MPLFEHQRPNMTGEHLRWNIEQPEQGGKLQGWICGPQVGLCTHHAGVTKPCKSKLTGGKLSCQWCQPAFGESYNTHLPWIDEHGQKNVTIFGREMENYLATLSFGSAIVISKKKYKAAKILVTSKEWSSRPCPWLSRMSGQSDIRPFLLMMWKDSELIKFFGLEPDHIPLPSTGTVQSKKAELDPDDLAQAKKTLHNRIGHWKSPMVEALLGESDHTSTPHLNGKVKPRKTPS